MESRVAWSIAAVTTTPLEQFWLAVTPEPAVPEEPPEPDCPDDPAAVVPVIEETMVDSVEAETDPLLAVLLTDKTAVIREVSPTTPGVTLVLVAASAVEVPLIRSRAFIIICVGDMSPWWPMSADC